MAVNSSAYNRSRRRAKLDGDTHFITLKVQDRRQIFREKKAVQSLKECIRKVQSRYPFEVEALVTMPDHIHLIVVLPQDDDVLNLRVQAIQTAFTKSYGRNLDMCKSNSDGRQRQATIWRRRYWNHLIENDEDLAKHVDYIYWNPVKHGLVKNPTKWPHYNLPRKARNQKKTCMPGWIGCTDWE